MDSCWEHVQPSIAFIPSHFQSVLRLALCSATNDPVWGVCLFWPLCSSFLYLHTNKTNWFSMCCFNCFVWTYRRGSCPGQDTSVACNADSGCGWSDRCDSFSAVSRSTWRCFAGCVERSPGTPRQKNTRQRRRMTPTTKTASCQHEISKTGEGDARRSPCSLHRWWHHSGSLMICPHRFYKESPLFELETEMRQEK